jgi:hypothetical protein
MLAVVFHATNTATDSATRPANGSVLPGLSGNELLLQTRQHRFSLGHRQPQIGDVTEIARADDLRDVDPLLLTIGPDCYQPDNSRHASAPIKTSRRVIPLPEHTPNHETAPVAGLLSELLPLSGAQHASTVRNRTRRVGEKVVSQHAAESAEHAKTQPAGPVVVGLDGGHVRSCHRQEERHFEVIAGKVIDAAGGQHRFAFVRNGPAVSAEAFTRALAAAGVNEATPATVLCDGDAGLWRMQHAVLPDATVVLDWWHIAIRFEHALQTARGLGAGSPHADHAVDAIDRAKWRLWHGRWTGCRRKLAGLYRWTKRQHVRETAGVDRLQRHLTELLGYLERNQDTLVHYAARRRCGEPISTAFVESAVNEIVAKRMNKKQQMRWNRATVQPFLDVRCAVLNDTLEDAFRHRYPGFRSANDDQVLSKAA